MKKISLLLMLITVLLAAGCSNQEPVNTEPVNVTIAGLKGPTSIGMIKMIDEKALNTDKYNVNYVTESAPDALTGKIINGEIQISSVPINLAPILYNKTGGKVQLMAVNTIGNLYIVGTDDIESIGELEGKILGMSAKGSTPDFAMNYLLNQNNISDKVELNYAMDHATMSQSVIAEDTRVALLPQPFVTQTMIKNSNVKILVDLNEAWKAATDNTSQLYTGAVIVNKDFAENNKDFIEEFLKQYEASVNWVLENQKDASLLVEKNEIMPSAAVVEKAIPYCGIVYEPAHNVKDGLNEFYKILFDSNPASVGGKLPDEGFYFTE
ncbi:ABC transporter substrate-binding protein [Sedimentibacter hydroxybenzoicus DSM 7310]|uniref:ABC transporter substrate-binding protein n=1 Tax=Sedimentibacter hydroxybenzoicus DSM 7310 TaxID=1123245 RepID=A0A974GY57_SEDHY|nr:ABC transporter substrate-binding protein [Sedimentibacter hydroxybenzoicus]NYB75820.1 ABC transporter substrate-binding protein [Sedimentibacter hydroxybenzoicus DSM 7310]